MYRMRYEAELKKLKISLLKLCDAVLMQIRNSVNSLIQNDTELAKKVAGDDDVIDAMEGDIEKQCHSILLIENPVAKDFREVFAILKMITDLERIGDQAEDIANIVISLGDRNVIKKFLYIPRMAETAVQMVSDSVNAFIKDDLALADNTVKADDIVDELFIKVKQDLIGKIKKNSENAEEIIAIIMIAKYLERIGDHAVNICEWTRYFDIGHK
jgi:phosphate transport system protein